MFGVLVATLSLANSQNALLNRPTQHIDISAVVSVITNGEQQHHANESVNHHLPQKNNHPYVVESTVSTAYQHSKITLLANINGIRAGPAII